MAQFLRQPKICKNTGQAEPLLSINIKLLTASLTSCCCCCCCCCWEAWVGPSLDPKVSSKLNPSNCSSSVPRLEGWMLEKEGGVGLEKEGVVGLEKEGVVGLEKAEGRVDLAN